MAHTIEIKACDNELIIQAFSTTDSYMIAHIKSGNNHTVSINITVDEGTYSAGLSANGVNSNLNEMAKLSIPSGDYYLAVVGYNWGGPGNFYLKVDGIPMAWDKNGSDDIGTVFTPAAVVFNM